MTQQALKYDFFRREHTRRKRDEVPVSSRLGLRLVTPAPYRFAASGKADERRLTLPRALPL